MTDEPLSARLVEVCDDLLEWLDEPGRVLVNDVMRHLREPLALAVVGPVKAGKSTLVNALIGRRLAPTAETECTQVVTWYRFGRPASAHVVLKDGSAHPLPFEDGLPESLGLPLDDVARIEVRLPEAPLRALTVVDTPGLASLTSERGAATHAAVVGEQASRAATGDVDAIVYVFLDIDKRQDMTFVEAFTAATDGFGGSALNAVGVLSRPDEFGAGAFGEDDPFDVAGRLAGRVAAEHAGLLATVIPVSGLLAETQRTGRLTESTVAALARLADVPAPRLKLWKRLRPHDEVAVDDTTMEALHRLIGRYGVRHGRVRAQQGAAVVYRWLEDRSGITDLESAIDQHFTRRADILKAGKAVTSLQRLRYDDALSPDHRRRVADILERVQFEPRLHRVRELRAAETLRRRGGTPPDVVAALERLLSSEEPAEILGLPASTSRQALRTAALEQAAWGQSVSNEAGPDLELAAAGRVLSRSFHLLAEELQP